MRQFRVRKENLERVRAIFPELVVCEPHRTIGNYEFYSEWDKLLKYTDEELRQFVGVRLNISGNQFHKALVKAGIVKKKN